LAAQLQAAAEAAGVSGAAAAAAPTADASDKRPTLIVAPPQCERHLTCPDPLPRGICPPPENVERLRVLVEPGRGILRCDRLAQLLAWELNVAPAPISDILRVHDWNYVRKLQVRKELEVSADSVRVACHGVCRPCAGALLTARQRHTCHLMRRSSRSLWRSSWQSSARVDSGAEGLQLQGTMRK
jgi:hypothetical protein